MHNCVALRYAIEGDLRFISHSDSLRLFERAMARAGIPVRYSQGYNPRPRIRIALPRPVGVASHAELLLVELTTKADPVELLSRLASQVPAGMTIQSAEAVAKGDRRLPEVACYTLEIEPTLAKPVAKRAAEFLSQDHVKVERILHKSRSKKLVDIRQVVLTLCVEDNCLNWSQSTAQTGTARVGEVLEAVGLPSCEYLHRVRREQVLYRA